jgi:hypothetical protein
MNFIKEPEADIAARLMWVDSNTLKYVNKEGIERKIDVSNDDFKELQFNIVPLY